MAFICEDIRIYEWVPLIRSFNQVPLRKGPWNVVRHGDPCPKKLEALGV